jgi:hypothetical protein
MKWPDKTGLAIPRNGLVTKDGFWFYPCRVLPELMGEPGQLAWVREDIWYFSERGQIYYKLSSTPEFSQRVIIVVPRDGEVVKGYSMFQIITTIFQVSVPIVVPTEYAELLYLAQDAYERWRSTWDETGYNGARDLDCYHFLGESLVRNIVAATIDIMTAQEEYAYAS